ncbi:MAG: hypothetical protein IJC71_08815 [Clostridia bacterium]|nr:hypothetical protein [Clostridia bacterium]
MGRLYSCVLRMFRSRIFSVMRRRDDLPEMPLATALLFLFGVTLFAAAGAKLASPADMAAGFDMQNLLGVLAGVLFLPLSVCFYALLILLWRRFASLLATPVMFLAMLAVGADLFAAVVISVSLLFVSYVFAVSLISRENRFRRLTALAVAVSVCAILTMTAFLGMHFDTFDAFAQAYMEVLPAKIGEVYSAFLGAAGTPLTGELTIPAFYLEAMARELFVMLPAYLGVFAIVLAWLVDFLAVLSFRILDCEDVFIEITQKITMPFSYAVVYAGIFVLTMLTSAEYNPLLYVMLRSVQYVMLLPCAAVGVRGLMQILEDKFYYFTREKLLAAIVLLFAFAFLGIMPFLLVTSAVGAAVVIRKKWIKPDKTPNNE